MVKDEYLTQIDWLYYKFYTKGCADNLSYKEKLYNIVIAMAKDNDINPSDCVEALLYIDNIFHEIDNLNKRG